MFTREHGVVSLLRNTGGVMCRSHCVPATFGQEQPGNRASPCGVQSAPPPPPPAPSHPLCTDAVASACGTFTSCPPGAHVVVSGTLCLNRRAFLSPRCQAAPSHAMPRLLSVCVCVCARTCVSQGAVPGGRGHRRHAGEHLQGDRARRAARRPAGQIR